MRHKIQDVITFIATKHGINDKSALIQIVANAFLLTKDRCVYYCKEFAIRFSSSNKKTFSNTVLSLSNLQKFDDRPFLVCLVTPYYNYLFLNCREIILKFCVDVRIRLSYISINNFRFLL